MDVSLVYVCIRYIRLVIFITLLIMLVCLCVSMLVCSLRNNWTNLDETWNNT